MRAELSATAAEVDERAAGSDRVRNPGERQPDPLRADRKGRRQRSRLVRLLEPGFGVGVEVVPDVALHVGA